MENGNTFVFDTAYVRKHNHKRVFCDAGDREKIEYEPVYDRKGVWHREIG